MDLSINNGDLEVLIMHSSLVTIIHTEDSILLKVHNILHHMVTILHHRLQEATMAPAGSKGLQRQCMDLHCRLVLYNYFQSYHNLTVLNIIFMKSGLLSGYLRLSGKLQLWPAVGPRLWARNFLSSSSTAVRTWIQ